MTTLTRHVHETVVLETSDGTLSIDVVSVKGEKVRLRFLTPNDVRIIQEENLTPAQRERYDALRSGTRVNHPHGGELDRID